MTTQTNPNTQPFGTKTLSNIHGILGGENNDSTVDYRLAKINEILRILEKRNIGTDRRAEETSTENSIKRTKERRIGGERRVEQLDNRKSIGIYERFNITPNSSPGDYYTKMTNFVKLLNKGKRLSFKEFIKKYEHLTNHIKDTAFTNAVVQKMRKIQNVENFEFEIKEVIVINGEGIVLLFSGVEYPFDHKLYYNDTQFLPITIWSKEGLEKQKALQEEILKNGLEKHLLNKSQSPLPNSKTN